MAELILSEDERNAVDILGEWSDEAIANGVRYCATVLKPDKQNTAVFVQTCAQILCSISHDLNSTNTKIKLDGVTYGDKELGSWIVTIKKIA